MKKFLITSSFLFTLIINLSHTWGISGPPLTWDRSCQAPSTNLCLANQGVKFPARDISFFFICGESGQVVRVPCFCDTVFDMSSQICVRPNELTTIACEAYDNTDPRMCGDDCIRYLYENFERMFGEKSQITKEDVGKYLKMKN